MGGPNCLEGDHASSGILRAADDSRNEEMTTSRHDCLVKIGLYPRLWCSLPRTLYDDDLGRSDHVHHRNLEIVLRWIVSVGYHVLAHQYQVSAVGESVRSFSEQEDAMIKYLIMQMSDRTRLCSRHFAFARLSGSCRYI